MSPRRTRASKPVLLALFHLRPLRSRARPPSQSGSSSNKTPPAAPSTWSTCAHDTGQTHAHNARGDLAGGTRGPQAAACSARIPAACAARAAGSPFRRRLHALSAPPCPEDQAEVKPLTNLHPLVMARRRSPAGRSQAVALVLVLGLRAVAAFARPSPCNMPARSMSSEAGSPRAPWKSGPLLRSLYASSRTGALPRRALLALPGAVYMMPAKMEAAWTTAADAASKPVGYRATTLLVGDQEIPVAVWYPLAQDDGAQKAGEGPPYRYRINIANLFRAFLGFKPPIPSPEVRSGGAAVRPDAPPASASKGGIVFAHGMLGSRFDMVSRVLLALCVRFRKRIHSIPSMHAHARIHVVRAQRRRGKGDGDKQVLYTR